MGNASTPSNGSNSGWRRLRRFLSICLRIYFVVLFFQSLAVLVYGIVIRSRSLTFFPIGFVVLGVVTVVYSALKGVATIFLIGCTGVILLMLGVFAVLARERISKLSEKISDWKA